MMRARAPEHPTKEVGGGTREKAASASFFFFCSFFRFNSFLPSELYYHGLEHVRGVQVLFSLGGKTFPRRKFRREKFKDHESFDVRILAVGILELLEVDLRYFQLAK